MKPNLGYFGETDCRCEGVMVALARSVFADVDCGRGDGGL